MLRYVSHILPAASSLVQMCKQQRVLFMCFLSQLSATIVGVKFFIYNVIRWANWERGSEFMSVPPDSLSFLCVCVCKYLAGCRIPLSQRDFLSGNFFNLSFCHIGSIDRPTRTFFRHIWTGDSNSRTQAPTKKTITIFSSPSGLHQTCKLYISLWDFLKW